jgi:methionyl-tRNA formyltransferase
VKVILLGSGPFGLPALDSLHQHQKARRLELIRVVTRPDRPHGRGKKLAPTPVRARALELGLACDAPESAQGPEYLELLESLKPDLFVVVDYGEMLRKRLREIPRIGVFNLHASLLPRHRGAAPIAHALLAGESITGVTLFRIEKGLDSGPIVDFEKLEIGRLETAGELEERLSRLAAQVLERNLDAFRSGSFPQAPQDENLATFAPKLEKKMGGIDWSRGPEDLTNFVRALNPWPGAFSFLHAAGRPPERTLFLRAKPAGENRDSSLKAGRIEAVRKDGFTVSCGRGLLEPLELQREGKAALDAGTYLRGRPLKSGDYFSPEDETGVGE